MIAQSKFNRSRGKVGELDIYIGSIWFDMKAAILNVEVCESWKSGAIPVHKLKIQMTKDEAFKFALLLLEKSR